jgi:chemotaxis signal transduction protein
VVIFTIGDTTFAIAAEAVSEIQSYERTGVSRQYQKVRVEKLRDGRAYSVVDGNQHFRMLPTQSARLLLLAGSRTALAVDTIERMAEVARVLPLPRAFNGEDREWYAGLALVGGKVIPVVSPKSFVALGTVGLKSAVDSEVRVTA